MNAFKKIAFLLILLFIVSSPSRMAFSQSGEEQPKKGKLEIEHERRQRQNEGVEKLLKELRETQ